MIEKNADVQKVSIVLLCTDRDARVIIGKGGVNIKENIQKTNVQISIRGQYGCERYVVITGTPINVAASVHFIGKALVKSNLSYQDLDLQNNDASLTMVYLIPIKVCGAVIGHQGQNIKNIREVSKTSMKIIFDKNVTSGQNILIIEGEPSNIQKAIELVAKLQVELILNSTETEGLSVSLPPADEEQRCCLLSESVNCGRFFILDNEITKAIIGRKGGIIKSIRSASGASVSIKEIYQNKSKIEIVGSASSVELAVRLIDAEISYDLNSKNNYRAGKGPSSFSNPRSQQPRNQEDKANAIKISDEVKSEKPTVNIK